MTAGFSVWMYMWAFYGVRFNKIGVSKQSLANYSPLVFWRHGHRFEKIDGEEMMETLYLDVKLTSRSRRSSLTPTLGNSKKRPMILIATMEYDIEDWAIKIKFGGLVVMAQLMGKDLPRQDLIWIIPCVGGVEYPVDIPAEPMIVTILGTEYEILVQYHKLNNITYVLLDAPIFHQRSKSEPYPARVDDLDSVFYYSAWNACIALTIQRFPFDLYHVNNYHGALAPLHLLAKVRTIPCALSLHNAEF